MDIREIGKTRSQRIEIDYYRKPTGLSRSRWILALVALALAGAYGLMVLAAGGGTHVSTGPLAAAHAMIENDCAQCHRDFTPIAADAQRFASPASLQRNEQACRHCHQDIAEHFRDHLTAEFATIDQQCSGCHAEHQGRNHDLVRVDQQACTQCHGELATAVASPGSLGLRASVTAFTAEAHGDFSSLQGSQPRRILFDHAQHMLPGQVGTGSKGALTLAMIEPGMRDSYRKRVDGVLQSDESAVTLSCADCHVMAGVPGSPVSSDDEIGRHLEAISYDRHCVACHAINPPGRSDETLPLPHAAPWTEIELLMAAKISGGQQTGAVRMPRQTIRSTPLIGEGDRVVELGDETAAVDAMVTASLAAIQTQCLKCHVADDISDDALRDMHAPDRQPLISSRRLRRGIYDHAAHRRIDCVYCHQAIYSAAGAPAAGEKASPLAHEAVRIGGIETCTDCHRGVGTPTPDALTSEAVQQILGGQSTWASDSCSLCHRYHWQRADVAGMRAEPVLAEALRWP